MQFSTFFAAVMALAALFQGSLAAPAAEAAPVDVALRQNTGNSLNCARVNLPSRVIVEICGCDNPLCPPCAPCPP